MNKAGAIQFLCGRFLGCQMRFLAIFELLFGDALSRIFKIFKNKYPNSQKLLITCRMSTGPRASDKKLEKGHPSGHASGQVTDDIEDLICHFIDNR